MLLTYKAQSPFKDELIEGRRLHYYDRGEAIPLVEEGVWQVYRGVSQLSQVSETGEEILLGWAQPGHFFGLWLTYIEAYQAKALSEIYLRWYNLNEIESSPQLTQMMLNQMSRRLRQTEALLAIAGLKRVEDRLLQLLKLLKEEMGQTVDEQRTRLTIRLTHQNIASAIGTTRVTVTRLLGDFQRQGIISIDNDRHIIL
jgi:CRP-like cAMP-binding protein